MGIWLCVWLHILVVLFKYKHWNVKALLFRRRNDMAFTLAENLVGFDKVVGTRRTSTKTAICMHCMTSVEVI